MREELAGGGPPGLAHMKMGETGEEEEEEEEEEGTRGREEQGRWGT